MPPPIRFARSYLSKHGYISYFHFLFFYLYESYDGRCRKQLISYVATALSEEGVFGDNSVDSYGNFVRIISSGDTAMSSMLKELCQEFVDQNVAGDVRNIVMSCSITQIYVSLIVTVDTQVVLNIALKSLEALKSSAFVGFRSVLEDIPASLICLSQLCAADKKCVFIIATYFPFLAYILTIFRDVIF